MEFNQWVCKTGKHQPHTDTSMKRASLPWAGGSRRAAVKDKMRKNVSLVHQELREPQSILDTPPRVRVSLCFRNSPPANIISDIPEYRNFRMLLTDPENVLKQVADETL